MFSIHICLEKKRKFMHEISSSSNQRTLVFKAWLPQKETLKIAGQPDLNSGIVRIHESASASPENLGEIMYIPTYTEFDSQKIIAHSFQVEAHIPSSTFETLLNADLSGSHVELFIRLKSGDSMKLSGYSGLEWITNNDEMMSETIGTLLVCLEPNAF